jgi:glycosyltransferase involved in cell wall biosynthesis
MLMTTPASLDRIEPLASICIPVYNGAKFIHRAIHSALNQTYANTEIIIVDDRSTDDSWSIISTFDDKRIVAVRNESNLGPEGNWNKALAACSGKYIKLFHQDDLLAENCVAAQVRGLETHPDAVLAFCRRRIIGPRDQHYFFRGLHIESGLIEGNALVKTCMTSGTNLIGEPSAVLLRRSTADLVGPFSARFPYVIDLDYWVRLLQHGNAFYSDEALASFRVSPQQWSVAIGSRQSNDFIQFISTHPAFSQYRRNQFLMLQAKCRIHGNGLLRSAFYSLFLSRLLLTTTKSACPDPR